MLTEVCLNTRQHGSERGSPNTTPHLEYHSDEIQMHKTGAFYAAMETYSQASYIPSL